MIWSCSRQRQVDGDPKVSRVVSDDEDLAGSASRSMPTARDLALRLGDELVAGPIMTRAPLRPKAKAAMACAPPYRHLVHPAMSRQSRDAVVSLEGGGQAAMAHACDLGGDHQCSAVDGAGNDRRT
jgi:hypothetical protein